MQCRFFLSDKCTYFTLVNKKLANLHSQSNIQLLFSSSLKMDNFPKVPFVIKLQFLIYSLTLSKEELVMYICPNMKQVRLYVFLCRPFNYDTFASVTCSYITFKTTKNKWMSSILPCFLLLFLNLLANYQFKLGTYMNMLIIIVPAMWHMFVICLDLWKTRVFAKRAFI